MRWLLDSNTVNYLMRQDPAVCRQYKAVAVDPGTVFVLSPMVDFEIQRSCC